MTASHDERLLDKLRQDTDLPEETEQLLPVVQRLNAWQAPMPTRAGTARLVASLQPALPLRHPPSALRYPPSAIWQLMRAQLGVVRHEIWAASALVMLLGVLVTLAMYGPAASGATLPFVLVAPIVAAVGIAFLYGPAVNPALEIELAAPASPRMILLARLVLVFGFDLGLGLAGSAALAFLRAEISFWPLVSTWLAPMAFLSTLALLLTVLTLEPNMGILVSLGLWIVPSAMRFTILNGTPLPFAWLDLMAASARLWLWPGAFVLGGLALWIGGHEEHWLRERA